MDLARGHVPGSELAEVSSTKNWSVTTVRPERKSYRVVNLPRKSRYLTTVNVEEVTTHEGLGPERAARGGTRHRGAKGRRNALGRGDLELDSP